MSRAARRKRSGMRITKSCCTLRRAITFARQIMKLCRTMPPITPMIIPDVKSADVPLDDLAAKISLERCSSRCTFAGDELVCFAPGWHCPQVFARLAVINGGMRIRLTARRYVYRGSWRSWRRYLRTDFLRHPVIAGQIRGPRGPRARQTPGRALRFRGTVHRRSALRFGPQPPRSSGSLGPLIV